MQAVWRSRRDLSDYRQVQSLQWQEAYGSHGEAIPRFAENAVHFHSTSQNASKKDTCADLLWSCTHCA